MFRRVVLEAFEPDLAVSDRPFRPALRVRQLAGCPGVFEMTWSDDGRATFSYGAERMPGQPHVIWRQVGIFARRPRSPAVELIALRRGRRDRRTSPQQRRAWSLRLPGVRCLAGSQ
jgi:hypothetical protein